MLHLPGAGLCGPGGGAEGPQARCAARSADPVRPWSSGRDGLHVDSAGGPGVEHSAALLSPQPIYFDPENIVRLASRAAATRWLRLLACWFGTRRYAHKIPFIVKINHSEMLTYPEIHDQTLFASVDQAFDMGAVAVGATVYYGSAESRRQIIEISEAFAHAHELGMATVLWAYLRNSGFKRTGWITTPAPTSPASQPPRRHHQADIIKQKQAENNGGYTAIKFGKTHPKVYSELTSDHADRPVRYQVANCYMVGPA